MYSQKRPCMFKTTTWALQTTFSWTLAKTSFLDTDKNFTVFNTSLNIECNPVFSHKKHNLC